MRKGDIKRLRRMLKELDDREDRLQRVVGDRTKGSARTSDYKDAEAIRRILTEIDSRA